MKEEKLYKKKIIIFLCYFDIYTDKAILLLESNVY
jgi:hypothetical protein